MNSCDYENIIRKYLTAGYKAAFFNEKPESHHQLILRHDVDFSCKLAHKMALLESKIGVKSTYFFMMNNPIYNVFSRENKNYIREIKSLGHEVSIHFDMIHGELNREICIFQEFFDVEVNIVSIHRPIMDILDELDIEHTYLPKYMEDIKYISDSRGKFRYGHPLESQEFRDGKSMQLLTHPAWWVSEKEDSIEIIESVISDNNEMNKKYFLENSIPYREFLNRIDAHPPQHLKKGSAV